MSDTTIRSTRRDFLKTIGGVLGGVSLLGHGMVRGQALAPMPNGYSFFRVLRANEGGAFGIHPNPLGNITGSVMMASPLSGSGIGYVYVHGTMNFNGASGVFAVVIDFTPTPPVVLRVVPIAVQGVRLSVGGQEIIPGHIGTGACNALGEYVTTITPNSPTQSVSVDNSPGVYLFRPSGDVGQWSRIIGFADPVPQQESFYGADFGDVALDDDENLLLAAATTQSPAATVSGFAGSQALIVTSLGATTSGRVVLQTGDILPSADAVIDSIGLIDLARHQAFAAQVNARPLASAASSSGTALVVGNTQAAPAAQRIVAASPELISADVASRRNITSGQTFFGPRVDSRQDVAFVSHASSFVQSVGSNNVELLGYYSRGLPHQLLRTKTIGGNNEVVGLGAPCIDSSGLMYGTELLGSGETVLFVSDGENLEILLRGRQPIHGRAPEGPLNISEILFGQHSTQVDAFGRLAFTAEFLLDPLKPLEASNVITSLVIGIPK